MGPRGGDHAADASRALSLLLPLSLTPNLTLTLTLSLTLTPSLSLTQVRVAKKEAARRRAAVLSIQKARRGRAERAEREEMAGGRCREI